MADLSIDARRRSQLGKHVHALRRRGEVPAVLYGHRVEPVALTIDERTIQKVWHRAGQSHLVDLVLDGARPRKVLIRELQVNPRTARMQHVDFFAVNLREKLNVDIPLVPLGDAPAVAESKVGVLQQIMNDGEGGVPSRLTSLRSSPSTSAAWRRSMTACIFVTCRCPDGVTLAHGVDAGRARRQGGPAACRRGRAGGRGRGGGGGGERRGAAAEGGGEQPGETP